MLSGSCRGRENISSQAHVWLFPLRGLTSRSVGSSMATTAPLGLSTSAKDSTLPAEKGVKMWSTPPGTRAPTEAGRLVADDPLVDEVQAGIGPGPGDRAGVVHGVARSKRGDIGADGSYDAGGVVTEHLGGAVRIRRGADLTSTGLTDTARTSTSRS
jgi:hypothetical protein